MPRDLPRIPMPTSATSAEIARLPSGIRRQALFSARLNTIGPTVEIGKNIRDILDGNISASDARVKIRKSLDAAGYTPPAGREGTLLDHTSDTRLNLILKQNVRKARGYAYYAEGMDPDILDTWPAWELLRVEVRKNERDWQGRWQAAGGTLTDDGRMVALKTSPVWRNISRFGDPFPPFDYGSGMGVEEVERGDAVALGLLGENDTLTPEEPEFPDVPEANLPGIERMPELQTAIEKAMGEYAEFNGGVLSIVRPAVEKIGATSSTRLLGLPPLESGTIDKTAALIKPREARIIMSENPVVKNHKGESVVFHKDVEKHWNDEDRGLRLKSLRHAQDAVREPQDVWTRPSYEGEVRDYYSKTSANPDGTINHTLVVVNHKTGRVVTWISKNKGRNLERQRTGLLAHRQGA